MIALSVSEWLSAVEDLVIASSEFSQGEAGALYGRGCHTQKDHRRIPWPVTDSANLVVELKVVSGHVP